MISLFRVAALVCMGCCTFNVAYAATRVELKVVGDWDVQVKVPAGAHHPAAEAVLTIIPPPRLSAVNEKHDALPEYNPNGPQYARGVRLHGIIAEGLTAPDLLDPQSVVVRLAPDENSPPLKRGTDYEFEARWGGLGRIATGKIPEGTPVYISYQYTLQRLDSIVLTADGKIVYREGEAKPTAPHQPELKENETRLANVWFTRPATKLSENQLFPILESEYPESAHQGPSVAEQLLPMTMAKIRKGEPVKILAWGDSVTECSYLPEAEHWQNQFVERLRKRFPNARIDLVTEGWGGRTTDAYLGVPAGQPHNFQETVLNVKPDLIISEFVNDAYMTPEVVEAKYSKLLADFQNIGAEWIILTPHYVRPDWMGIDQERDIDQDPRPYVQGLRQFSEKHKVALADAALRYGRLWRQGIPYNSLMVNCINHPDARGLKIFADALMELFPEK